MGEGGGSGKIGKVALRVHSLVQNPHEENVVALASEVDKVASGFDAPDQRTEVDGPSGIAIRQEKLRRVVKSFRVAIRLIPPPSALGE
jgi:hypothetical protein